MFDKHLLNFYIISLHKARMLVDIWSCNCWEKPFHQQLNIVLAWNDYAVWVR